MGGRGRVSPVLEERHEPQILGWQLERRCVDKGIVFKIKHSHLIFKW